MGNVGALRRKLDQTGEAVKVFVLESREFLGDSLPGFRHSLEHPSPANLNRKLSLSTNDDAQNSISRKNTVGSTVHGVLPVIP
jgi:hypothetical protein